MMIQLERLSVTYSGGVQALQSVSLNFHPGEFTVILGASGSGKSTLLRCLNGLIQPTAGSITVDGWRKLNDPKVLHEHRQRTGMIFQQHQLIGRQTALQNVLTGRLAYHSTLRSFFPLPKVDQYIALECLERVGLLNKALVRVDNLSGGQQQRVGIARALAQQPQLMLADEPVASLDPTSSHKVISFLRQISQESGIAAIMSLHQVDLAKAYADRIVGISQGRIVFDGNAGNIEEWELNRIYGKTENVDLDETEEFMEGAFGKSSHGEGTTQ
ncbi:phosphonate ABC transporter ATP-binding protein [Umezakia ovalisporum]|uniref:Phosphonate ABC transporter ATP-binding protein n=2 Tax=Umezakia ovalisporum TaxID=75695 RepID=A0AA43GYR3_9CYAN|nr:phosphonate ABC transporter ATP-binding protein [Umezakia ovalisporum]MDH6055905.1 phosphonate ABC transporter ATP-binding protein [Umezakia ovalisporum FSS-43]MDH6063707.1 phosphonate ABC transporter ATP-binding protein [Umezakia ovalisporum FSS-62]MDH6072537.1 phosphonate ABC transporter ATP-binding protein [Umezakia ovalisporum CobakiLakeA]MDH6074047.1 phosphonate ABC transporter ATP-binding protein [Umezakia ovalisporum CS-1034]MDH6078944.1 phosphonate ABC transporter ATP-binding protei